MRSRVTPLDVVGAALMVLAVVCYQAALKGLGVGLGLLAVVLEAVSWLIDIGGPKNADDPDAGGDE